MHKIHKVEAEEKLKDIAEKYNVSVQEIKEANPNMSFFKELLGDEYADSMQTLKIPFSEYNGEEFEGALKKILDQLESGEKARYRGEQNIITKFNSIVQTTVDSKREYLVSKKVIEGTTYIKIDLVEDLMHSYPESLAEATKPFTDIDLIKCKTIASIDGNGKIKNIFNHKEIINEWKKHKKLILAKYNFLRMPDAQKKLKKFKLISTI